MHRGNRFGFVLFMDYYKLKLIERLQNQAASTDRA